jgi:hypothetical protein
MASCTPALSVAVSATVELREVGTELRLREIVGQDDGADWDGDEDGEAVDEGEALAGTDGTCVDESAAEADGLDE